MNKDRHRRRRRQEKYSRFILSPEENRTQLNATIERRREEPHFISFKKASKEKRIEWRNNKRISSQQH